MRARGSERDPGALLQQSANDRFKARWDTWMARSLIAAAAAHAVVFAFWPSWSASDRLLSWGGEGFETALVSLGEAAFEAPGGPGPVAFVVPEADASDPEDDASENGSDAGENAAEPAEDPGRWDSRAGRSADAVRARLERGRAPLPSIAEPELSQETTESEPSDVSPVQAAADEDTGLRIGGSASAAESIRARTAGGLDLDRLGSARPELALSSPSSEILVRNPEQVEAFLRRRVAPSGWAREGRRQVSVTIWVDERGSVEWAEIGQSSGRPDFDEIALELFSNVVAFYPAREQGLRVPVSAIFWLNFPW